MTISPGTSLQQEPHIQTRQQAKGWEGGCAGGGGEGRAQKLSVATPDIVTNVLPSTAAQPALRSDRQQTRRLKWPGLYLHGGLVNELLSVKL
jgi:hypothetical protein